MALPIRQMRHWPRLPTPAVLASMAAVALLTALLAGCASMPQATARPTATPRTANTPTPPATTEGRLTLRVRQAVGAAAQTVDLAYLQSLPESVSVTITLVWSPAWKTDFARAQTAAKTACFAAQSALWTSGAPLRKVTVTVLGQALDDYANIITSPYAAATLTSSHANAMTWSTLNGDTAWSRYDEVFLRPTYVPDWIYPPPASQTPPASSTP